FRGYCGKASLFKEIYNVRSHRAHIMLMVTGVHSLSELSCSHCNAYLGFFIVCAHEESEKWKEGSYLLEL
ncbi:hypothetical protein FISHEDRAFT_14648, partial [Fistulina hepatica ATCC 64428]